MPVVLTAPAFGLKVGDTYTGPEEAWLLAQGYASQTGYTGPGVAKTGAASSTPDQDVTEDMNREDAGDAYQFGKDTALPARVRTITPDSGPIAGGTVVTIDGDNMIDVTSVTFGGVAGTALTKLSDNKIRVTTPATTAGAKAVAVVDPSGTTTVANGYTYQ